VSMSYEEVDERLTQLITEATSDHPVQREEIARLRREASQCRRRARKLRKEAEGLLAEAQRVEELRDRGKDVAERLRRMQLAFRLFTTEGFTLARTGRLLGVSDTRCGELVSCARRVAEGSPPSTATPDASPLDSYELPVRTHNALRNAGVHTVGQLRAWVERDGWSALLQTKLVGRRTLAELRKLLPDVTGPTPDG